MRADITHRVSICQFSTFRWTFDEDVFRYATYGFDSIGVWRRKIEDYDPAAAIDLLYETRMSVSSLHWAGGFTGDGCSFADSIEDAIQAIQLASRLHAGCLIIHPGSRNGHTTKHAHRLFNSALTHIVPVAADYGVKLAVEPMCSKQSSAWTFMQRFEDTLEMVNRFPAEQLGIVLDTYHHGFDPIVFESLETFVDRIELVQLADRKLLVDAAKTKRGTESHRLPLGQGELPLEAWLGKLQSLGYRGRFEIEVHGKEVEGMDYFQLLDMTADYFAGKQVGKLLHKPVQRNNPSRRVNQRLAD